MGVCKSLIPPAGTLMSGGSILTDPTGLIGNFVTRFSSGRAG